MPTRLAPGLDDAVVGTSGLTWVGGTTGDLVYRGFDVRALAPGVPFESVAYLLLHGDPPPSDPAEEITRSLARARAPAEATLRAVDAIPPSAAPLDALRTIVSLLGDGSVVYPPTVEQGYRLIALVPVLLARYVRRASGQSPVAPRPDLGHAANYLWMLRGVEPQPAQVRALDGYLVLLADHGMNASTFVLRIAISTQTDLFSAASGALGTLKGPLHGGAPSRVSDMLDAVGRPENAERWISERLARRELLYGFGHRAYKAEDPRGVTLHRIARSIVKPDRLALAEAVEAAGCAALERAHPGARLYANVEFYSAVVLEAVGLPPALFTPTFAVARTVGWTAHAIEQATHNRLIRPDIEYTGPPKGREWPRPVRA